METEEYTTAQLKAHGWTDSHIKRLLTPTRLDYTYYSAYPTNFYSREAVEAAEATDEKLQKRIAKFQEKKQAEKKAAIASKIDEGGAVWRKVGPEWLVYGKNLIEGENVIVTTRKGQTKKVGIKQVVKVIDDVMFARPADAPFKPAPEPVAEPVVELAAKPVKKAAPATLKQIRLLKSLFLDECDYDSDFITVYGTGDKYRKNPALLEDLTKDMASSYISLLLGHGRY